MLKMTVGMGSVDDYIPYCKAGADEVFIGYMPQYMLETFGILPSINRREVLHYPVQIGSLSELTILSKMVEKYKVPVTITLNSLFYHPKQFPYIKRMILECLELKFNKFIIADLSLLIYLKEEHLLDKIEVHLSGEFGEINSYTLDALENLDIQRIIFHRKVSLENMSHLIVDKYDYEAFMLNEMCHFHGGYCMSLHCDELRHMCMLPYRYEREVETKEMEQSYDYVVGASGCGLCSLWKLKHLGVEYYKLVSRGNYQEETLLDIKNLKKAFVILEESQNEEEYMKRMKEALFKEDCLHHCYYLK